jgi:hypothetical protein
MSAHGITAKLNYINFSSPSHIQLSHITDQAWRNERFITIQNVFDELKPLMLVMSGHDSGV